MKIKRRYMTLRGLLLFAVAAVLLFSAVNYQRNALFWLAYGVVATFILGIVASVWLCRSARLRWVWDAPVWSFSNQVVTLNGRWLLAGPPPLVTWIKPDGIQLPLTYDNLRPGELRLPEFRGITEYPLGLVKTAMLFEPPPAIWVYPAPINHRGPGSSTASIAAEPTRLRAYQAGDTPNRILKRTQCWPQDRWVTRSIDSATENAATLHLRWDQLPATWTVQQKAEQLSYEIQQMPQGELFSLTLSDGVARVGSGVTHQHKCWQLLALQCAGVS